MSDYVPITQGIRDICNGNTTIPTYLLYDECDNIDAMYKSLEGRCTDLRGFADRVREAAENHEDMTVFGVDYMALDEDESGIPVHVDDVMAWPDGKKFTVNGIGKNGVLFYIENGIAEWTNVSLKHHAPTVEDVLREFVTEFNCDDTELCDDEIIERFAKRLQLADGDDE